MKWYSLNLLYTNKGMSISHVFIVQEVLPSLFFLLRFVIIFYIFY